MFVALPAMFDVWLLKLTGASLIIGIAICDTVTAPLQSVEPGMVYVESAV